jgi:hypothetical protein
VIGGRGTALIRARRRFGTISSVKPGAVISKARKGAMTIEIAIASIAVDGEVAGRAASA